MGNRGVDLAEIKHRRAQEQARSDRDVLLVWAHALASWLGSPLEAGAVDERVVSVPATGEEFILSRRRARED